MEPSDMSAPPLAQMDELLQRLLDDQLRPAEMEHLAKAMREDTGVRDYYIDSMLACAVIRRSSQVTGELTELDLIEALSADEGHGGSKRIVRPLYAIAAIIMLGMLILTSLSLLRPRARGPEVGVLAGGYEAQWRGAQPRPGEPLHAGPYDLREGAVQMDLGRGASLLLEAPCQVELTSAGEVILQGGRLAAVVPPQARGFRVRTRTAVITDLGTEFGVITHPDGSTEAHVLEGRIRVALDPNESGRPASLVVNEGQATEVDAAGRTIRGGLAAQADLFLLQLPTLSQPAGPSERVSLADLVGGGNGHGTGTLDRGIDVATGQAFRLPPTVIRRSRRSEFYPTPQWGGIDGVFVPNGGLGPVVISSTGLRFWACPETVGTYYGGPANSGKFFDLPSQQFYAARLNGIRFGTPRHPALTLHPNAGITFDLDRIRQDNPKVQIDRFTAVCGIPKDAPEQQFSSADVWVLLDGVVRLHLRYPAGQVVVEKVDVPIPAPTRFLTLATTCSGRADYSWILLGDPFLGPAAMVQLEDTR